MAEHLVADEDGRFRLRYSREATARARRRAPPEPAQAEGDRLPDADRAGARSRGCWASEGAERAAAELRRCQIAVVPGSHAVLWDALAETGALVRDFVTARIRA